MNFFEQLKQKPQHVKGQYAFMIATVLTAGIGLIWSMSLPARFADMGEGIQSVTGDNRANALDGLMQNTETLPSDDLQNDTSYETSGQTFDETLYRNAYGEAPPAVSEERMFPVGGTETTLPPTTSEEPVVQNDVKPTNETPSNIIFESPPTLVGSDVLIPKAEETYEPISH